jgi:hypothetical protein
MEDVLAATNIFAAPYLLKQWDDSLAVSGVHHLLRAGQLGRMVLAEEQRKYMLYVSLLNHHDSCHASVQWDFF